MEQPDQEQSPFSPEEQSQEAPAEQAPEAAQPAEVPAEPAGEPVQDSPEPAAEPAAEAAPDAAEPAGEFADKVIECAQCGAEFVHTAAAQAFYKEKGFANEPKRCPACRKSRKAQSGYTARGGAPRQMYPAVCADCNKETQVPFKPSGTRPVYCLDCYRKRQSGG